MLGHLYPNLELAQAKSSLRYRVASTPPHNEWENHPSVRAVGSASKRHHRIPALHVTEDALASELKPTLHDETDTTPTFGAAGRRRQKRPSPQPLSLAREIPRPASWAQTNGAHKDAGAHRVQSESAATFPRSSAETEDTATTTTTTTTTSSMATNKLEKINHIIARVDQAEADSSGDLLSNAVPLSAVDMEFTSLDAARPAAAMGLRPFTSLQAQRKVVFLLESKHTAFSASLAAKDDASRRDAWRRSHRRRNAQPPSEEQAQSKYLITTADADNAKSSVSRGKSNPDPQSTVSKPKLRLDRQLRRVSIVSFDPMQLSAAVADVAAQKKDTSPSKTDKMHRASAFGLYSIREIMAVIRLFWFLDVDRSGGVTMEEIRRHEGFFSGLGYDDVATVFGEMDRDGNGVVTLRELLRLCFGRAKPHQLDAMVTLAKVGNIEEYLAGHDASPSERVASADAIAQRRLELLEIFRLFDRNGDGKVSMHELLQALHVDEQEQPWAIGAASSRAWSNATASAAAVSRARSGSLTKDDVVRFYQEYDKNGDEELDFDEFLKLMEVSFGAAAHRTSQTFAARSSS